MLFTFFMVKNLLSFIPRLRHNEEAKKRKRLEPKSYRSKAEPRNEERLKSNKGGIRVNIYPVKSGPKERACRSESDGLPLRKGGPLRGPAPFLLFVPRLCLGTFFLWLRHFFFFCSKAFHSALTDCFLYPINKLPGLDK